MRDIWKEKFWLLIVTISLAVTFVSAGIALPSASHIINAMTATTAVTTDSTQGKIVTTSASGSSKTIRYTLVAEETTLEIAPGVRVPAWTYNGTIPGPTMRATEGDRVIIHFINKTPLPHTIHLHGDHDEKDDGVFQEVQPGQSYTYDFIAGPAGALMYHCHVMPVSQHIRMGLYGAFIVDPKIPLPPAREYVLVAGEYDTKNQLTELPEYMMFNGYADQYWNNPLPARTNETVRIYFINLSDSPAFGFHIHGTLFKAYPSGVLENQPLKVQTWEVAAGNAAIFEVSWPWEGRYLFHLHGTPEEKGTMAYFNVTNAATDAVDGVDVSNTKSIDMVPWQSELTKTLQKADANGTVIKVSPDSSADDQHKGHMMSGTNSEAQKTTEISIPEGAGIKTQDKTFTPTTALVSVGSTVTWTNKDSTPHTVSAEKGELFGSDYILKDQTFEHTFTETGEYQYFCSLHPWMQGTIKVVNDDGDA